MLPSKRAREELVVYYSRDSASGQNSCTRDSSVVIYISRVPHSLLSLQNVQQTCVASRRPGAQPPSLVTGSRDVDGSRQEHGPATQQTL